MSFEDYLSRRKTTAADRRVDPFGAGAGPWFRAGPAPTIAKTRIATHTFSAKEEESDSSDASVHSYDFSEKPKEGRIYRARDGKHDYVVHWKGKKITFGDASMPNRNHNDKARENFNARHNCAEKKDKSKAGYWACKVWRRGFKAK